jgi:hypothetical protein
MISSKPEFSVRLIAYSDPYFGGPFYRFRLRWSGHDQINAKPVKHFFLGRLFKNFSDRKFEAEIFAHDVKTRLHFVI